MHKIVMDHLWYSMHNDAQNRKRKIMTLVPSRLGRSVRLQNNMSKCFLNRRQLIYNQMEYYSKHGLMNCSWTKEWRNLKMPIFTILWILGGVQTQNCIKLSDNKNIKIKVITWQLVKIIGISPLINLYLSIWLLLQL